MNRILFPLIAPNLGSIEDFLANFPITKNLVQELEYAIARQNNNLLFLINQVNL